jgi:pilus assembly protein Flp/PilA
VKFNQHLTLLRRAPMLMIYGANCLAAEGKMRKDFANMLRDESGATAIEYGLIAALISVVILGVLSLIGTNLNTKFTQISDQLK